ncbi:hypothetical protein MFRU_017g00390 [Monilinia fructicola]|nr:hypothetical protein MFRU_017g00390 [Monilinia fructicola]
MIPYQSRKGEMLMKLFDEGRENAEYRNALNEVANDEVVASLPEPEKLKALECAIYKKLFDDFADMKLSQSTETKDDAKDATSTVKPKQKEVLQSNKGTGTTIPESSVVDKNKKEVLQSNKGTGTTIPESSVVDKNKNTLVDSLPSEASSVKTNLSYADQAAKVPPPPKAPELTFMQKRYRAINADAKKRMGEAAWNRLQVEGRQAQEAAFKLDDIMDRRRRLLPMMPGGIINQYSSFAPANWNCENIWSAEDGKQIQKAEEKLKVHLKSIFEKDLCFRVWPEPSDWDAFEKDQVKGLALLARAEKFVEFWIWDYISRIHYADKVPLITCLGWFLLGDDCPRYREFIKKSVNPKPMNSLEATKFFQAQIQDSWKKLPGVIASENREHDEIKNRSSEDTGTIPQPILKDTWKQRQVNEEGVSRQISKESSFIDANGVIHVKRKAAEEADKTTNKKMKRKIAPAKDSRGVTHISKEAADKADEGYAKETEEDAQSDDLYD